MRIFLALVLLAGAAMAEPYSPYAATPTTAPPPPPFQDHVFVGGGAGLGGDHFLNAFVHLELGLRLGNTPLYAHAMGAIGKSVDVEGGGNYQMLKGGLEARTCPSLGFCLFAGADIGHQRQVWEKLDEMTEHHSGLIYGPRFGLDAGGERTRFRAAVDVYRYRRTSDVDMSANEQRDGGFSLTLTIVQRM